MSDQGKQSREASARIERARERWGAAESAYTDAIESFVTGAKPLVRKSDLVTVVRLRVEADQSREKYVKRCREQAG